MHLTIRQSVPLRQALRVKTTFQAKKNLQIDCVTSIVQEFILSQAASFEDLNVREHGASSSS